MRPLVVCLSIAILLSGCSVKTGDKHFTVPEDAGSSGDAHDGDGYDLRVRVTDENGTPIQGAAVVYFTTGSGASASGSGSASSVASGEFFWAVSFDDYDMVAGLRTDAEGIAVADLEPGGSIHVAAGDVDGMTTEALADVALGSGGDSGTVTIPLYPDTIRYAFDVEMGNEVGRGGMMEGASEVFELPLSDDSERDAAYRARLYSFDVDATWSNGPMGGADLYVGAGTKEEALWIGDDDQQLPMDGENTESLAVQDSDLDGQRAGLAQDGTYVHLFTDWVSLSFDGVDVAIDVDARLKGSDIVIN